MIIDVNVNLSRWPFRRLPCDETPRLVAKLREHQIHQAWAGSFDALLHKDIAAVNSRLVDDCQQNGAGILLPVGSVNPMLPDWQEDLRRCAEEHQMKVIRIHPNYHGYRLDSDLCRDLFRLAATRKLILQLVLNMEDVRTHHPLMQVANVDPRPLLQLVERNPDLRLIVMNNSGTIRSDTATKLTAAGEVYFEISHAEQVGALDKLTRDMPYERLLFGSHFPFFNLEAALLKFRESQLGGFMVEAIQHANTQHLLTAPDV